MRVSEIFESIQGEGDTAGRVALFIRVQGCPLDCVWCDTKYSVPFEGGIEKSVFEISNIISEFIERKEGIVVFTGGEPLAFQDEIHRIITLSQPRFVEFETSGIYLPKSEIRKHKFNVSPKLPNAKLSGGEKAYNKMYQNLKVFSELKSIFKFVISNEEDLEIVMEIITSYSLPKNKVFLMPEGTSPEEILSKSKLILPFCINNGLNYSPRLQVFLNVR
ncbi:MAG: 7-carboxy-7-deazaguanine synthase QueE [Spirochaetia bacterium]|nr:7-carboxy-7-deazaguanine synthase QueE [Spirochaetota bacterium]MCX8096179.1 7-carboxy-7-deazaguanine synthase QueE [Spirochaetota bacterium]MDW8111735.1 7-carboxy-7-deazaguanine synthase QueE [Spirochaetia bacterium]